MENTKKKRVLIAEVAEMVGVHRTTVSKVLSHDPAYKASLETKKKILQAAKQIGYQSDHKVHSLKKTKIFGLLDLRASAPDSCPFASEVLEGVQSEARKLGINYYVISKIQKSDLLQLLAQDNFIGLIGLAGFGRNLFPSFELYKKPLISIEESDDVHNSILYKIRTDSRQGMYEMTKYLIQSGHQRIYYLGFKDINGSESAPSFERYCGVAQALREAKIPLKNTKILIENKTILKDAFYEYGELSEVTLGMDMGYRAMKQLLETRPSLPLACVCYSDLHAEGALKAIAEQGLRVPEDVSLAGYDNIERSAQMSPPLTTVSVPRFELGRKAVQVLMEIEDGTAQHENILPHEIICRESVLQGITHEEK